MNKRSLLYLMAVGVLLAGCASNELEGGATPDIADVPISLTATVEGQAQIATRAGDDVQSTQFEAGETFYAYFPSNVTVGNTTFTTTSTSGATTPATQPYFVAGQTSATVHAYYPYYVADNDANSVRVTNASTSFSVQPDQSDADDLGYKKSDLMYATADVTKASPTGELAFTHRMSKILVNVTLGSGVSSVIGVHIVGGYRTITIPEAGRLLCTLSTDPDDLSDANSASGTYITMFSGSYSPTTEAPDPLACAALLPPQTIGTAQAAAPFLQIVTAEGTATYSLSKTLASGNCYTINLTVSSASIGLTTTINPWGVVEEPMSGKSGVEAILVVSGASDNQAYTGNLITFGDDINVYLNTVESTPLTKDVDYTLYYTDNDIPGTATIVAVGKGTYANLYGSQTFTIASKTLADVRADQHIGWFVTGDGYIYHNLEAVSKVGKVPQAMIAYISGNGHGLAYALSSAEPLGTATFSNSSSLVDTWKTSHVVSGGEWRVPSVDDYKYMFQGCGGESFGGTAIRDYDIGNFLEYLGIYSVKDIILWTSTTYAPNPSIYSYCFVFRSPSYLGILAPSAQRNVRAVLAF